MAKKLNTSSGMTFIIDDEDYEEVSKYKWKSTEDGYVRRNFWLGDKCKYISLHRMLINAPEGLCVDHINGNKFDNRRSNLRLATRTENIRNSGPKVNNKSGYKGVSFRKDTGKWKAQIRAFGKKVNLGQFDNKHDAARMYNFWAVDLFGEFAWVNKIEEAN
ncbi:MAG: HNH endonuclease [Bacillota bacterium]